MFKWLREFWRSFSKQQRPGRAAGPPAPRRPERNAEAPREQPKPSAGHRRDAAEPSLAQTQERDAEPKGEQPKRSAARRRRRPPLVRVQVGLDFGTSVSKILYRVPTAIGYSTFRLPRRDEGVVRDTMVPSQAVLTDDGEMLLGAEAGEWAAGKDRTAVVDRFKMLVAGCADGRYLDEGALARFRANFSQDVGRDVEIVPDALAAAYLGVVMGETQEIIRSKVDAEEVDVIFNTCVPIDQAESPAVMAAFERVAAVSDFLVRNNEWRRHSGIEFVFRAAELLKTLTYSMSADETRLFLVPEAIASFQAYQQSLVRTEGLHALIDIGAGTTDVSIAYLAIPKHTASSSSWYAARSIPLAGGYVEDLVASELKQRANREASREELIQAIAQRGRDSITNATCRKGLETIWNRTTSTWGNAYRLYPGEHRWKRKVTVFMCGGGAHFPSAFDVFKESWQAGWGPYAVRLLPAPSDFPTDGEIGFERLSVAYGLCTPLAEMIGPDATWQLPGTTPIVPKPPRQMHPAVDNEEREPGGPT